MVARSSPSLMELQRVGQASLPQTIKTLYTCQTGDRERTSRSILDNKSPLCIKDKQKRGTGVETGLTSVSADMEAPDRHLKKLADVNLLRLIHIALDTHSVQPRLSAHYSHIPALLSPRLWQRAIWFV